MKVYGYARVSTATQAETGYGLDTQQAAITKFAKRNGLKLERIYVDAGISANIKAKAGMDADDELTKRKALIELLDVLEAGDTLIVLNTSRLWRSPIAQGIVTRELAHRGAIVKSIEQPSFDLYVEDPSSFLINTIMAALDSYERMNISRKLAAGRSTKAAGGDRPAGKTPYGYRWSADRKHVEIDPVEAEAVKLMFTLAQRGCSLGQIADTLTAQGITPRAADSHSAKTWTRQSIATILHNDYYTGDLHYAGREVRGNHEPLISKVQFGKVAASLARKNKSKSKRAAS